jgi:hypothetical protein
MERVRHSISGSMEERQEGIGLGGKDEDGEKTRRNSQRRERGHSKRKKYDG